MCEALTFLLDNIYIRFGSKLYRHIVGIPMGTNCAPLVADLFLFSYERDFMLSLSEDNQSGVIEAFNSTSRYLDDLLNIDNNLFDSMVNRIFPSELQLNKANVSDVEAPFLDLHLSISDDFVRTKIYDKRDDFDFDIVNFPFLDGDVPRSASYGVYISQLIRFARVSSHVDDFNTRNKVLTAILLRQGYVKGRPLAQQLSCLTDSERPWVRVPVGPRFFPSLLHLVAQCGFAARATSIKKCMFRCSSVVPSRFGDESN